MKPTWTKLTPGEKDLVAMQIDQHHSKTELSKVLNQLEVCYHQSGNFTTALVRFPDGSLRVGTAKRNTEEDQDRPRYATGLSLIRALAKGGMVVPAFKEVPKLRSKLVKIQTHNHGTYGPGIEAVEDVAEFPPPSDKCQYCNHFQLLHAQDGRGRCMAAGCTTSLDSCLRYEAPR